MIIAQLLLPGVSEYERNAQRIDFAALSADHDIRVGNADGAAIVHIYGPGEFDPAVVRDLRVPYVSNGRPERRPFRKPAMPRHIITPLKGSGGTFIPEAAGEDYFGQAASRPSGPRATAGTYARPRLRNIVEQTAARIQRFRDDVDWLLFDAAPSPDDLRGVDLWVDPAAGDDDLDGFVAEAMAAGVMVAASRTAINSQRLEKGRTGILVPPLDPNEWTHAILTALFKPELRNSKIIAAQQTVSKFRPRHRARALVQLYESIVQ